MWDLQIQEINNVSYCDSSSLTLAKLQIMLGFWENYDSGIKYCQFGQQHDFMIPIFNWNHKILQSIKTVSKIDTGIFGFRQHPVPVQCPSFTNANVYIPHLQIQTDGSWPCTILSLSI